MKQSSPENTSTHFHCEEADIPIIQNKKLAYNEAIDIDIYYGTMIFILDGAVSISYEIVKDHILTSGQGAFIPPSCHLIITANEASELILLHTKENIYFCNGVSLESLSKQVVDRKNSLHLLEIKPPIRHFLQTFQLTTDFPTGCDSYFELKIREFFYLLMRHYPNAELAQFLSPILSSNSTFLYFIYRNYDKVKTAQELASLFGNSLSAFEKQFQKTFGTPVYKWMLQKKVRKIYHELMCSDQSLRKIAHSYGFSSHTQFNDFCKKHLGDTPGRLRELKNDPTEYKKSVLHL